MGSLRLPLLVCEACRDFEPSPIVELQDLAIYVPFRISRQLALGRGVQVLWSNIAAGALTSQRMIPGRRSFLRTPSVGRAF
jgi:hypothetical protein